LYGELPNGIEVCEEGEANSEIESIAKYLKSSEQISRIWVVHAKTVEWRSANPGTGIDDRVSLAIGELGNRVETWTERGASIELFQVKVMP
jgi:hypothetical protein